MKLSELKSKLEAKNLKNVGLIRKEYLVNKIGLPEETIDKLKIIGITGSKGKTTVAYIIHKYLQAKGYKSVLYSSMMVDSKASYISKDEAYGIALKSEENLLAIIKEVEAYKADYLVLEVNDVAIEKGLVKDIPFDVRVLTNLNPLHNEEQYSKEEYIAIKESFFKDLPTDKTCKCVIGIKGYDKALYDEIMALNTCEKLVFTTEYIAKMRGLKERDVKCLLTDLESNLNGLKLTIKLNNQDYLVKTNLIMRYNVFNILCAMTSLEALGVFDIDTYQKILKEITIAGRAESYKINERLIIIDNHCGDVLKNLKDFKKQGYIKNIRVVIGSMGTGYKNWEARYKTVEFQNKRSKMRKEAMQLIADMADYVYLTEDDNANENVRVICEELEGYLKQQIPSKIIEDRKIAIYEALKESEAGDVILISGRGNKRTLCNSATTLKLIKDQEALKEAIIALGW